MTCVLCGSTSTGVERFTIGPEMREVLEQQFPRTNLDVALANYGICDNCSALPLVERRKLADKIISDKLDEYRRELLKINLEERRN